MAKCFNPGTVSKITSVCNIIFCIESDMIRWWSSYQNITCLLQNVNNFEKWIFLNQKQGGPKNSSFHSEYLPGITFKVIEKLGWIKKFSDNVFKISRITGCDNVPYFRRVFTNVRDKCEILVLDVV